MTDSSFSPDRPLITFALFAYNQEQFIAEAVQGAFDQTYSPLEIILSDDCSPDRTFEIMQEMAAAYQGPHTIVLNRNERNLGLIGHINRVMEMVKGELIVVAAGDDVSLPERTEILYLSYAMSRGQAYSIYSKSIGINEKGCHLGVIDTHYNSKEFTLENLAEHQVGVPGNTQAWQRGIFDIFGTIDIKVIQEDVVVPFRAALLGQVQFVDKPLVLFRFHGQNTWQHPRGESTSFTSEWHRKRQKRLLENMLGIWKTKIHDLEIIMMRSPERRKELEHIRLILQRRLVDIKMEQRYLQAQSFHRIIILLSSIRQGVSLVRLMRWVSQYALPGYYYKIARLYRQKLSR